MKSIYTFATASILTLGAMGCDILTSDDPNSEDFRFGYSYNLIVSDSLPRLQGDSLYVQVSYSGCGPGHAFTLESSQAGPSSYEIWLFKENAEDCLAALGETRAFKVPDEVRDAQSVELVTPTNERIELIPEPTEDGDTNRFGYSYTLIEGDGLPRLQGDSLYVTLGYTCAASFTLRHMETGDSSYEIWLHNAGTMLACAVPVIDSARAFKVPDEVRDAQSVELIAPTNERIELKN